MNFNLQRLKYERMSRKISQDEMAKAIGVVRSTYHKKENGDIKISVEEFSKILDVLEIPQSDAGIFFDLNVPKRELIKN